MWGGGRIGRAVLVACSAEDHRLVDEGPFPPIHEPIITALHLATSAPTESSIGVDIKQYDIQAHSALLHCAN